MPFTRHITPESTNAPTLLDQLTVDGNGSIVFAEEGRDLSHARRDVELYHYYKDNSRILYLPFTTVQDYLELLEMSARSLSTVRHRLVTYLAAAVSDFYIPHEMMAEHKIQSTDSLKLELFQVPKILGNIKSDWAPEALLISFKLETDQNLVIPKARKAISAYGVDLVIANELHTRRDKVFLVTADSCEEVVRAQDAKQIEVMLVSRIVLAHQQYLQQAGLKLCPLPIMSRTFLQENTSQKSCLCHGNFWTGVAVSALFFITSALVTQN